LNTETKQTHWCCW